MRVEKCLQKRYHIFKILTEDGPRLIGASFEGASGGQGERTAFSLVKDSSFYGKKPFFPIEKAVQISGLIRCDLEENQRRRNLKSLTHRHLRQTPTKRPRTLGNEQRKQKSHSGGKIAPKQGWFLLFSCTNLLICAGF